MEVSLDLGIVISTLVASDRLEWGANFEGNSNRRYSDLRDNAAEQAIRARTDQARETLKEAEVLFEQDFWRGTINRSYYAMFYAVLALAASRGVAISKHTHAIAFLDKEFIRTGIFPKELSAHFILVLTRGKPVITAKFGILTTQKLNKL